MPWYDYQCEKCGTVFEVQHAMGATDKIKCKHCGSTQTVKIYSAAGVLFKGNGFYVTDSRSHNPVASSGDANSMSSNGNGNGNGQGTEAKATTPAVEKPKPAAKTEPAKKS